jgi:hypothetical protein
MDNELSDSSQTHLKLKNKSHLIKINYCLFMENIKLKGKFYFLFRKLVNSIKRISKVFLVLDRLF